LIIRYFVGSKTAIATFGLNIDNPNDLRECGWSYNDAELYTSFANITQGETNTDLEKTRTYFNSFSVGKHNVNPFDVVESRFKIIINNPRRCIDYTPYIPIASDYFSDCETYKDDSGDNVYKFTFSNCEFNNTNVSLRLHEITPQMSDLYMRKPEEPYLSVFELNGYDTEESSILNSSDRFSITIGTSSWDTCMGYDKTTWTGYFNSKNSKGEKSKVTCISKPENASISIVDGTDHDYEVTITVDKQNDSDFAVTYTFEFENEDNRREKYNIWQRGKN